MQNEYLLAQQRQSAACLLTGREVPAHVIYHTVQLQLPAACDPALTHPAPPASSLLSPQWDEKSVFKGRWGSGFKRGWFYVLRGSCLTLNQHQGTLSQQHNHPKPLWGKRRSPAKSGLCTPSARMRKRKVCLLLAVWWQYQKWRATSPGWPRVGWEKSPSPMGIASCSKANKYDFWKSEAN